MKPAQKLKGARLEAGQTQERDDASLLAHREESKDAVKKPPGVFTVCFGYGVSCGLGGVWFLRFWMGGRTDAMGYSAGGILCRSPVEHAGAAFISIERRRGTAANGQCCSFFGAMSMLGPYVTFGLSNMASFQKFNLPELSAFLPGLLCAVAGMAVGAAVRAAKRKRAKR